MAQPHNVKECYFCKEQKESAQGLKGKKSVNKQDKETQVSFSFFQYSA